jgi:hypothetical protein
MVATVVYLFSILQYTLTLNAVLSSRRLYYILGRHANGNRVRGVTAAEGATGRELPVDYAFDATTTVTVACERRACVESIVYRSGSHKPRQHKVRSIV